MKIAFDAKRAYCNFTGLGNHSRTTLDILTHYFPENEYLLYTPRIKQNEVTIPYLHNPALKTVLPSGMIKGSLWRTYRLADEASKEKVDIFHGLSNELPVSLQRKGIRSVVTIHDVAFRTFPDMYHWVDRKIYDRKWRYAVKHADRIIAISECTKQDILRFYDVKEEKIDVVYQPVSPIYYERAETILSTGNKKNSSSFSKKQQQLFEKTAAAFQKNSSSFSEMLQQKLSEPFMLYVGSINSRKNLLGAVKALEMLPGSVRIPLLIVGGGREYKREVEQYVSEHGLQPWCHFLSNVSNEQLQQLYAMARLFVYPSFYEGFGLPLVEARLSGCPVISSNVSSLPEAAGSHALLVDPNDTVALSKAMDSLITDDALHDTLAVETMKEAMETLHPKVLAGQLMKVYTDVL